MPVPASITDLSTTAGSNSPPGSESPATLDDYIRTLSAFIAQLRNVSGLGSVAGQFLAFSASNTASLRAILGTVSQSGGVPTGALVEKGSNANGVYFRFAGGLQICVAFEGTLGTINITSATGSVYTVASGLNWTYPAAFVGTPLRISIPTSSGTTWGCNTAGGGDASSGALRLMASASISGVGIAAIAVGLWHT